MEEQNKTQEQEQESTGNAFYDWLIRVYERFNLFSEFKEEDSVLLTGGKIIVRIIGFFILLLLSPFILFGLMLAFFAAL